MISTRETSRYTLDRVGIIAAPEAGNKAEAWGILNPGSARTRENALLLYPRAVAEGNYSRIARAGVVLDPSGQPCGIVREGFVLEPEEVYEREQRSNAGVEDARVTFLRALDTYVMAYVAVGRFGPRVALACSQDGREWRRLGLLRFASEPGVNFNRCGNKDCVIFPDIVQDCDGREAFALLHRPTYLQHNEDGTVERIQPAGVHDQRESIWISYIAIEPVREDLRNLVCVYDSTLFATPTEDWESLKIGSGAPPVLTEEGWLLYYHGVSGMEPTYGQERKQVCYQAGAMLLDRRDPRKILYRSSSPVLSPHPDFESEGVVPNVVFPTAVDVRGRRLDVYYGAADSRIGVASTTLDCEVITAPSAPRE